MCAFTQFSVHIYIYIHIYIYTYTHILYVFYTLLSDPKTHIHSYTRTRTRTCTHTCTRTRTYTHTHTPARTHTRTLTHTHTHTHTCTPSKLAISLGTFRRFSKVSSTLILYTEFSSELTFENTHLEVLGIRYSQRCAIASQKNSQKPGLYSFSTRNSVAS